MSANHVHSDQCCSHTPAVRSVHQTLDELDFERGIWSAALTGDEDKIKQHLKKRTDPDVTDSAGYTALHYAARNGHYAVCRLLLEAGASVDPQTRSGSVTPLHRASYSGHANVVSLLIQYGATVSHTDTDGKTPLHKACEQGHVGVAAILLAKDPKVKDIMDKKDKVPSDYIQQNNSGFDKLFAAT
ncbi:hypothetical protein NP493_930g02034 [Ridgeia piscesae]|uniref:Ankyrin repeat domain-containing protein 39 n=1 Tax=Ridgeia piscesae TaxID=27915 RepID=A0AAD9KJJ4_RIDPI|nr:hypothetical protein NP493_930g02034 [Ridgeia piscesae]